MRGERSNCSPALLRSLAGGAMRMDCLDDATLEAWSRGQLDGNELASAEQHLDDCALCSATMIALAGGRPELSLSAPALAAAATRAEGVSELEPGQLVGRHRVVSLIGRGAMGVVYLATDPELERQVALKLIAPGERVLGEAQAMARLSHPNVVAIYDVGRTDDAVYLAMEFVPGKTLSEWLRSERRGWKEVRDAFVQAGRGLAAAHAAGLVHRDFKPDNVIVGDDGRVRVTDFGLARGSPDERDTGRLIGTPAYMAPEQLAGKLADEKSDQFSVAVALWEALFGARPFAGESSSALRQAIARGPERPPGRKLPRFVERALRRALAARPEDRFETLAALLTALERDRRLALPKTMAALVAVAAVAAAIPFAFASRDVADPCAGSDELLASSWSEARARRTANAIAATGAPGASRVAERIARALDAYANEWLQAHRDTCRATHVRGEQSEQLLDARMHCLKNRLATLDALGSAFERADSELVARADRALDELAPIAECAAVSSLAAIEPPPADPEKRARIDALERQLASVRAEAARGSYAGATHTLRKLHAEAKPIAHRPLLAALELELAKVARRAAAYADAERAANAALVLAGASHDDFTAARAWLELTAIAGEQGRFARIEELESPVRAALARIGDPALMRAALAHALGVAHTNTGRFDDADRELRAALEIRTRERGAESAEAARTLSALGNLARSRGQFQRALELHEQAHAIDERLFGREHPSLARHHHNLAGVLRRLNKPAEALRRYEQALALETRGFGARHASVGLTQNSIGLLALDRGDALLAQQHFERALSILEPLGHPDRGVALHNLGLALAAKGSHSDAVNRLDAALAVYRKALGERHERIAAALSARAESERALGEAAAARATQKHALAIARDAARSSPDAAVLVEQLEARPVSKQPARTPRSRPLGSTTYAPAQTWDPD